MRKYGATLLRWIATLGPIGYLPAPGTWASLATLPVVVALRTCVARWGLFAWYDTLVLGIILLIVGILNHALPHLTPQHDPKEVVLDEVAGMIVTVMSLRLSPFVLGCGFVLFRVFDITKPLSVGYVEQLPGAWGIVLDDVLAGILAHIVLLIILRYVGLLGL